MWFTYVIIGLRNLIAKKIKTLLTMLGIVIGVSAVIVIFSVSDGAQSLVLDQIRGFGSNLIGVLPGKSEEDGPPASAQGIVITTLTYKDALDVANPSNAPFVTGVAPYVKGVSVLSYQDQVLDSFFTGTSFELPKVEDIEFLQGRFFTEIEERSNQNVVVLGYEVYREFFGQGSALGKYIRIGNQQFEVVGVLHERGVLFFQNQDDQVFIPVTTAQKKLVGSKHLGMMRIRVDDPAQIDRSISDVERVLRKNHGITDPEDDDFSVRSSATALDTLTTVTDTLKFFLAAVAGIALLVGGIGIMNIMLMTVQERTREIGLRKAIGAKNSAIQAQFLMESVLISLLGGIIGILIGVFVSVIIGLAVRQFGFVWDIIISLEAIILSISVSCGVGILFGYYPARKAARLQPIDALRTE